MAIITISRQLGSLGSEAAAELARELHYSLMDKDTLDRELQSYGISGFNISRFDEKKPGLWDSFSLEKTKYIHFLKSAILEFASRGDCIILGRASHAILQNIPETLHVRFIAPMEIRIERVKNRFSCDEKQAKQIIQQSDNDRAGFQKFFFDVNWKEPDMYDLTLNTGSFSLDRIVRIIEGMLVHIENTESRRDRETAMKEMCLSQKIATRILFEENLPVHFLEVLVHGDSVTLRGYVDSIAHVEMCEKVARDFPGVQDIVMEIAIFPDYINL
jgi:cytidylate kinase